MNYPGYPQQSPPYGYDKNGYPNNRHSGLSKGYLAGGRAPVDEDAQQGAAADWPYQYPGLVPAMLPYIANKPISTVH